MVYVTPGPNGVIVGWVVVWRVVAVDFVVDFEVGDGDNEQLATNEILPMLHTVMSVADMQLLVEPHQWQPELKMHIVQPAVVSIEQ